MNRKITLEEAIDFVTAGDISDLSDLSDDDESGDEVCDINNSLCMNDEDLSDEDYDVPLARLKEGDSEVEIDEPLAHVYRWRKRNI